MTTNGRRWCSARPAASAARWRGRLRGPRLAGARAAPRAASRRGRDGLDWVAGDAMDGGRRVAAPPRARRSIVHAVNPPGYRDWADAGAADARRTPSRRRGRRARAILLPGTVYNYGPDAWPLLREDVAAAPA